MPREADLVVVPFWASVCTKNDELPHDKNPPPGIFPVFATPREDGEEPIGLPSHGFS